MIRREEARKTQVANIGEGYRVDTQEMEGHRVLSHDLGETRPVKFLGNGGCRKGKTREMLKETDSKNLPAP